MKLKIELSISLKHAKNVKATTKRHIKSEAELLDHGTNNLLRALKQDMLKKKGRVDCHLMAIKGFGFMPRFLD